MNPNILPGYIESIGVKRAKDDIDKAVLKKGNGLHQIVCVVSIKVAPASRYLAITDFQTVDFMNPHRPVGGVFKV